MYMYIDIDRYIKELKDFLHKHNSNLYEFMFIISLIVFKYKHEMKIFITPSHENLLNMTYEVIIGHIS